MNTKTVIEEMPLLASEFSDDARIEYSKAVNPKPWKVAYIKRHRRSATVVILDANGNVVKGRSAFVRVCAAINGNANA